MKKWIYVLLLIAIIGLGGCQTQMNSEEEAQKPSEMNPEDLPDVRAFQDEFTREFLQSTEETREGYYPFLSGTGKYEMDFPAGGIVGEQSYTVKEDELEDLVIGVLRDEGEMEFQVSYSANRNLEREENHLSSIERKIGEDLEFEKDELEEQTIYLSDYSSNYGTTTLSVISKARRVTGV